MLKLRIVLFALVAVLLSAQAPAADVVPLKMGDAVPALALKDQHDRPAGIPADTRRIIFAADNDAASLVGDFLDAQPGSWLIDTRQVYLADIHKMPSLIARMIALPKLRSKPYRIVLGREAGDLAAWPRQRGCAMLIPVDGHALGAPVAACDAASLKAALLH